MADINEELGNHVVAEIEAAGGMARFVHTDVGVHEQVRHMIESTVDEWGRLDILVNNAYIGARGTVVEVSEEDWDRVMNVDVKALFLAAKYAFPHMERIGGGSIVNMASVHGFMAWPKGATYDTAKGAVVNLTRQMAIDGGPLGIRVNGVAPGWIVTHEEWANEERFRRAKVIYPLGRPGQRGGGRQRDPLPRVGRGQLRHRPHADGGRRADGAVAGLAGLLRAGLRVGLMHSGGMLCRGLDSPHCKRGGHGEA